MYIQIRVVQTDPVVPDLIRDQDPGAGAPQILICIRMTGEGAPQTLVHSPDLFRGPRVSSETVRWLPNGIDVGPGTSPGSEKGRVEEALGYPTFM